MKQINPKPFAKCSCGADLFTHKVTWLKKLMIFDRAILKLYNCPQCHTTKVVKVTVKSAPSQATSLYDREAA